VCHCGLKVDAAEVADHLLTCTRRRGWKGIHRHDFVERAIENCLRSFGFIVVPAQTGVHEGSEKTDFVVTAPALNGNLSVDVSITNPCAASTVAKAATTPGWAASARETAKVSKHGEATRASGLVFKAWVFETFGRWGDQVEKDVLALSVFVADPPLFLHAMRRTIAIAVQRGNSDMLASAVRATIRERAGERPRPTSHLPSASRALLRPLPAADWAPDPANG